VPPATPDEHTAVHHGQQQHADRHSGPLQAKPRPAAPRAGELPLQLGQDLKFPPGQSLGRGIKRRVSTRRQLKADRKEQQRLAAERDQLSRQLEDERQEKLAAGASVQNGRAAGDDAGGIGARDVRTTRRVSE